MNIVKNGLWGNMGEVEVLIGKLEEVVGGAYQGGSDQVRLIWVGLIKGVGRLRGEVCALGRVIKVFNPECQNALQKTSHLICCSYLVFALLVWNDCTKSHEHYDGGRVNY